jgi:hypothetical protein
MSFSNTDCDDVIEKIILNQMRSLKRVPLNIDEDEEELDLSVKETVYTSPVKCYLVHREKKRKYQEIYKKSAIKYYYIVSKESLVNFFKTTLIHKTISLCIVSAATFFFYYFDLNKKLRVLWEKIKGLFFRSNNKVREL